MPLLDHFRPPVSKIQGWSTVHAAWAGKIVDNLNDRWLPRGFIAGEQIHSGNHPEIDVATWEQPDVPAPASGSNGAATALVSPAAVYAVPQPDHTIELRAELGLTTEIKIRDKGGTLVAAIEIVSPSNKDRPRERRAFAGKVTAYVMSGVCVAVVDVVTSRRSNLHDPICKALELPESVRLSDRRGLYAVSYRPKTTYAADSGSRSFSVDIWVRQITIGEALPTLPLRLTGDTFVPLELEKKRTWKRVASDDCYEEVATVKTEREKMLAGELYDAADPELVGLHHRARTIARAYNASDLNDPAGRLTILQTLFAKIGPRAEVEPPFFCDYGGNIFAGDRVYMNTGTVILDCSEVHIGNEVKFGPNVHLYAASHPIDAAERAKGPELAFPIRIGNRCWIGGSVVVCPGVTIGDDTVIGAGSVVTKDIPAGVVAVGNPCRVIRKATEGR